MHVATQGQCVTTPNAIKAWLCNKYLAVQRRNKSSSPLLNQSKTIDVTTYQLKLMEAKLQLYISYKSPTPSSHNRFANASDTGLHRGLITAHKQDSFCFELKY